MNVFYYPLKALHIQLLIASYIQLGPGYQNNFCLFLQHVLEFDTHK
jgi:hypothetical protein